MKGCRRAVAAALALGFCLILLLGWAGPGLRAAPAAPAACDPDGVQRSGAIYRICLPTRGWNRDLILFAHGYVADQGQGPELPQDQLELPGGPGLADFFNLLGYGFAATSFSVNGLAIQEGVADMAELVQIFTTTHGLPDHIYLIGVSEGALVATLSVENHPDLYSGGLAICGPIGDFQKQLNYLGDFRVLLDYFFPELIAGSPISIPQQLVDNWTTLYTETVRPVLLDPANQGRVTQLLAAAQVAYDPAQSESLEEALSTLLRYNVLGTNDARTKLGGPFYDNQQTVYTGTEENGLLNAGVHRFIGDAGVMAEIADRYNTRGILTVPLVTAHTTQDPLVPDWHADLYLAKTRAASSQQMHTDLRVDRVGHCRLNPEEMGTALGLLVEAVKRPYRRYLPLISRP